MVNEAIAYRITGQKFHKGAHHDSGFPLLRIPYTSLEQRIISGIQEHKFTIASIKRTAPNVTEELTEAPSDSSPPRVVGTKPPLAFFKVEKVPEC